MAGRGHEAEQAGTAPPAFSFAMKTERRHRLYPRLRIVPKDGRRRGLRNPGPGGGNRKAEPIPLFFDGRLVAALPFGDGYIKASINIHRYLEKAL